MKHQNKMRNKLVACAMCVVMLGATLFATPWFSVLADDTNTSSAGQSYGAWSDAMVKNGSFEAGYEGKEVYGWHKTAMGRGNAKADEEDVANYLRAYTLTTVVEEDGNKVAALEKIGSGYVAATSDKIKVSGEQDYIVSFDYKTASATSSDGSAITSSNYFGVRLYVEELDGNGNIVKEIAPIVEGTNYYVDEANNSNWSTGVVQFKTTADTAYVVLYLRTGGSWKVSATVHLDNVVMEALSGSTQFDGVVRASNEYEVFNGCFDKVNYKGIDGRTAVTEMGPAGWSKSVQNDNFKISTVDGAACLELVNFESTDAIEVYYYSQLIPIDDITKISYLTADCKVDMTTRGGETLALTNQIQTVVNCVGETKNSLGELFKKHGQPSALSEWTKVTQAAKNSSGSTLKEGTKYIRVGMYVKLTAEEVAKLSEFKVYFDNFALDVSDKSLGYTKVTAQNAGAIRTGDYTDYYAIRRVDGGLGYEDAVQLYPTQYFQETSGILNLIGGVAFYSQLLDVTAGTSYKITFDYKIEGVTDSSKTHGADVFLRYWVLNQETGEYEYYNTTSPGKADEVLINNNNFDNTTGWVSVAKTFTPPENVVKVQVGLLMSVASRSNPGMKHSFANICVKERSSSWWSTTATERVNTDLLFKLTEKGNASLDEKGTVDVLDLVMMKKYAADVTLITDAILQNADMNVNTLINNADIELLHWKLLGVDTEAKATLVQGYEF